jgi:hypothetical protein
MARERAVIRCSRSAIDDRGFMRTILRVGYRAVVSAYCCAAGHRIRSTHDLATHSHDRVKFEDDGPKQTPAACLLFPSEENTTARKFNEDCPECAILVSLIDNEIAEIRAVVQGSFATLDEKLIRLFEKQDLRDRAIAAFYAHKRSAHARKVA